jgi:hypothetical protein
MRHMRYLVLLAAAATTVCAKAEKAPSDTAKPVVVAPPAAVAPAITLADVAGKWQVTGKNAANDSTIVSYELVATADTTGWVINFAKRKPIPVHVVSVAGDSIVVDVGPYESMVRKGVQVTTHGVNRLKDGKLVGSLVAHYRTAGSDSVMTVNTEGTRAP